LEKIEFHNKHKYLINSYIKNLPTAKKHQNNLFVISDQKALLMMEIEFR